MRTVWKFPLPLSAVPVALQMPKGAKIVAVAEQHSLIALWAEVEDPEGGFPEEEERVFVVAGTGHEIPDRFTDHRGTVFIGAFVFHVYEYVA